MNALQSQLTQLNQEVKELGEKIESLYAEKRKARADEKEEIQTQINKQEAKEKQLNARREKLEEKLSAGGNLLGDEDSTRQLRELHEAMVVKTQTVAFSNVKSDDFQVIQRTSGLKIELADEPPCTASEKSIDAFGWDDRIEPAQSDRYMLHLKEQFSINGRKQAWIDCRRHPHMLSIRGMDLIGGNLSGTIDVAVVTRQARLINQPQEGLEVILELKKSPLDSNNLYQARACLLAANVHSAGLRPIMILTDLQEIWLIMWLDGLVLCTHSFQSRSVAAGVIQKLINGRPDSEDGLEASGAQEFYKRRKLDFAACTGAAQPSDDIGNLADFDSILPHDAHDKQAEIQRVMRMLMESPCAPSWGFDSSHRPPPPGMYA